MTLDTADANRLADALVDALDDKREACPSRRWRLHLLGWHGDPPRVWVGRRNRNDILELTRKSDHLLVRIRGVEKARDDWLEVEVRDVSDLDSPAAVEVFAAARWWCERITLDDLGSHGSRMRVVKTFEDCLGQSLAEGTVLDGLKSRKYSHYHGITFLDYGNRRLDLQDGERVTINIDLYLEPF